MSARPNRPPLPVLLYDGQCRFCIAQAKNLSRITRGRIAIRSFHDDGVLVGIPDLTIEDCLVEMKLVDRNGCLFGGAEAGVRAIALAYPGLGHCLYLYYVPGLRWIADRAYAWIARNRYRLAASRGEPCDTGSCSKHTP